MSLFSDIPDSIFDDDIIVGSIKGDIGFDHLSRSTSNVSWRGSRRASASPDANRNADWVATKAIVDPDSEPNTENHSIVSPSPGSGPTNTTHALSIASFPYTVKSRSSLGEEARNRGTRTPYRIWRAKPVRESDGGVGLFLCDSWPGVNPQERARAFRFVNGELEILNHLVPPGIEKVEVRLLWPKEFDIQGGGIRYSKKVVQINTMRSNEPNRVRTYNEFFLEVRSQVILWLNDLKNNRRSTASGRNYHILDNNCYMGAVPANPEQDVCIERIKFFKSGSNRETGKLFAIPVFMVRKPEEQSSRAL